MVSLSIINFKTLLKFPDITEIFRSCMIRRRNKKQHISWLYLHTRTTLRKKNMRQTDFKKLFKFKQKLIWVFSDNIYASELFQVIKMCNNFKQLFNFHIFSG